MMVSVGRKCLGRRRKRMGANVVVIMLFSCSNASRAFFPAGDKKTEQKISHNTRRAFFLSAFLLPAIMIGRAFLAMMIGGIVWFFHSV